MVSTACTPSNSYLDSRDEPVRPSNGRGLDSRRFDGLPAVLIPLGISDARQVNVPIIIVVAIVADGVRRNELIELLVAQGYPRVAEALSEVLRQNATRAINATEPSP